ncbi:MAG: 3-deoxy-7-phosphoheptulonate synthase, partial [Candidatus Eisenbacteria bacterium]|nr:3-deoxy-7-phosphoheptulonate synthase [Candidatus Latescibacterota bacterium]MBD3302140.1 3-deoxy-7-phosphoheptulonate synthase [Candidatus Eisenbacteria bacterium]
MGIEEDRKRIDEIDGRILDLLRGRLEAARRIGKEKRAEGIPFYDPVRERAIIERIVGKAGDRFPAEGIRA